MSYSTGTTYFVLQARPECSYGDEHGSREAAVGPTAPPVDTTAELRHAEVAAMPTHDAGIRPATGGVQ
jgi:hypothetical protein